VRPHLAPYALVVIAVVIAAAACRARAPAPASHRAVPAERTSTTDASAPPPIAIAEADCRALSSAPALGIAVVTSRTPDCSGVGHDRIVLEVRQLARGEAITRVVTSRPLAGPARAELPVGAFAVVAIAPEVRPAETVHCVPLPAHEGTVQHAIEVGSLDEAEEIVAQLATDRACAPTSP